MSLFGRQNRYFGINGPGDLIPPRPAATRAGMVTVTNDTAMRHSAVWACLRLRNDLISTLPVDVYRRVDGRQVELPKPPIMVDPGGEHVDWCEWIYSSGVDLDRSGNTFGLITEVNALGLPARIDLQPIADCSVLVRDGEIYYRIGGKLYDRSKVWHERQFTVSGLPVGLSPVAYAAWTIGEYLSIQEFALQWFGDGAVPAAHLKNTARTVPPPVIDEAKKRFKAAVAGRDLFVSGNDWTYTPIQAVNMGTEWLEAQKVNVVDIARFFGCPATEIDAAVSGSAVTYANLTQDDLRFLIKHLGPALIRRENKISRWWLPQPRYIKFNTDAFLRMDPQTRAAVNATRIASRELTPDEARELENRLPLTEAQYAQFDRLFGSKNATPGASASAPAAAPQSLPPIRAQAFVGAAELEPVPQ